MKKKLLLTIVIAVNVLISTNANAQAPSWQWIGTGSINGGNPSGVTSYNIKVDNSGNSYVSVRHNANLAIQKYSPSGTMIWQASTSGSSALNTFGDIALDNNNNLYITGLFYQGYLILGADTLVTDSLIGISAFVAKLDSSGNFIWAKEASSISKGLAITVNQAGEVIVGGTTQGDPNTTIALGGLTTSRPSSKQYYFLSKLDANGNGQWLNLYEAAHPHPSNRAWIKELTTDNSGNIYGTGLIDVGSTDPFDFGGVSLPANGSGSGESSITFKTDGNGNVAWVKRSSFPQYNEKISGYGIGVDNAGNVYTMGWMKSDFNFGTHSLTSQSSNYLYGGADMFLVKYDNNGNEVWARTIVPVLLSNNSFSNEAGMTVDGNGDIYITGICKPYGLGTLDLGNGVTVSTTNSSNNLYVIKLNNAGLAQWAKWNSSSFNYDNFYDIDIDPAGNCYVVGRWITGTGYDGLPAPTGDPILVLKLGNNPIGGFGSLELNAISFDIYPNPTTETAIVENMPSGSTLTITDITGKIVYSSFINKEQSIINTLEFENGVYIIRVENNGRVANRKLVVSK